MQELEKVGFDEASRIVGFSVKHFRNVYKRLGLPYYKIGGKVRFSPRELYGWIERQAHNAINIEE